MIIYNILYLAVIMIMSFIINLKYNFFNRKIIVYGNKFLDECTKYNLTMINFKFDVKYYLGKWLWNDLSNRNTNYICAFLRKMGLYKYNGMYIYHRIYNNKISEDKSISLEGKFPCASYYRLTPSNKWNYNNVVTHTYDVQHFLYSYQHPTNCINKNYLIIRGYYSGHGSEIHVITSYFSLALSTDRIAIFDPYHISPVASGSFCKLYKNWLCFLEQLTNCTLSSTAFRNAKKYNNISQKDKYLYVGNTQKYRFIIP